MPRNSKPEWVPKGVIIRRGWYKYRPYLGCANGRSQYGKEQSIVPVTSTPQQFFRVYDSLTKKEVTRTIRWLLNKFLASNHMKEKSDDKQKDYEYMANNFCSTEVKNRSGKVLRLGDMPLDKTTKPKIQYIIDNAEYKKAVNRNVQLLKSAWNWAETRFEGFPANPCQGVRLNKEKSSDRYVEDWEYWLVYSVALSMRAPYFAPAMELSYLCRARRGEVFSLSQRHLLDQGVFLERSKGSDNEITAYSDRLNAAIELCKSVNLGAPTPISGATLLRDKKGEAFTKNALDSQWQRIIKKAKEKGGELPIEYVDEAKKSGARVVNGKTHLSEHFTFHAIKAKGITDHKMDNAGGHRTAKAAAIYQRKPKIIDATR